MNDNEWNELPDKLKVAVEIYREIEDDETPHIENVLYNMEKYGFDKVKTTFLLRKLIDLGTIVADWHKIGEKYTEKFEISPESYRNISKLYKKVYKT